MKEESAVPTRPPIGPDVDAQTGAPTKGHTPGPWTWSIEDSSMAILHREQDDGSCEDSILVMTICRNCGNRHKGEGWEWGRCYSPGIGNAHLIAAAPDLLAVMREMFCDGPVQVAFAGNPLAIERLHARCLAAIGKAEGTSPVMAALGPSTSLPPAESVT